ncbi:hypothetical protein PORY_002211 [Pneumocystis oryctolagi]|uniref:Uncharacterized protein n=1 Tax=Pneumocystis oryctolagi TaxID=42067 RepID=A0ACB7C9V1_9ASCO|nr:hypothetical protein PORY_002211 [Pneumocystis oryctolagi]
MRENIVLQFGKYANYLGTHFWNAQETYFTHDIKKSLIDHHVMYRLDSVDGKDVYTPRALIYDLKNGFGNLGKYIDFYKLQNENIEERNELGKEIYRTPEYPIHPFQLSLRNSKSSAPLSSETITSWSDYNMTKYHPRSLNQLYQYDLYDETFSPFYTFNQGKDLFRDISKENDLFESHLRPFLEECDNIQGLTMFSEINNGWGGFVSSYLDSIRDEMPKLCIWTFSIDTEINNDIEALLSIHEATSMFSVFNKNPDYNYEKFNSKSIWHTSAFYFSVIESLLIPCHSTINFMSMNDITSLINLYSYKKISYLKVNLKNSISGWLGLKLENPVESSLEIFRNSKNQKATSEIKSSSVLTTYHHSTILPSPKSFPNIFNSSNPSFQVLTSSLDTKFFLSLKKKQYICKNKYTIYDKDVINDLEELIEKYAEKSI